MAVQLANGSVDGESRGGDAEAALAQLLGQAIGGERDDERDSISCPESI
jgi:hypothetical protein